MTLNEVLNKQVANWTVLYMKLHNFHWYVKGKDFFTLHAKFEEFYDEANGYIDELAERQLIIGNKPIATLKECLEKASIQEASGNESLEQMIQSIQNDYNTIINELKEGIHLAQENNDEVTNDLFISILSNLEKHIWMLNAVLGK